jgi:hypothetical protein
MRLTKRDVAATLVTAAIVVPYVGYLAWGSMPFIKDARGMAATGVVLLLAWGLFIREPFGRGSVAWVAAIIGAAALVWGIAAAWLESDLLLAPFVAAIVVLWAIRMFFSSETPSGAGPPLRHQPSAA